MHKLPSDESHLRGQTSPEQADTAGPDATPKLDAPIESDASIPPAIPTTPDLPDECPEPEQEDTTDPTETVPQHFRAAIVGTYGRNDIKVRWAGPKSGHSREEALLKLVTDLEDDMGRSWGDYQWWGDVADDESESNVITDGLGDGGEGSNSDEDDYDEDNQGSDAGRRSGESPGKKDKKRPRDGAQEDEDGDPITKKQKVNQLSNSGATETASQTGATERSDLRGPKGDIDAVGKSSLMKNEQRRDKSEPE
jgi:hypothetical protein